MEFKWYRDEQLRNCGGYGKIEDFLTKGLDKFQNELKCFVSEHLGFKVNDEQMIAWQNCYQFLKKQLKRLIEIDEDYSQLSLAFEYSLPMEGGRRPDVLLFSKRKVVILEFKRKESYNYNDLEQLIGYQRDIKNYHHQTNKQNLEIISYLVLTKGVKNYASQDGIKILTANNFVTEISKLNLNPAWEENVVKWLNSEYQPLPNIVEATLELFEKKELPEIKNIEEGQIAEAVDYLKEIIHLNEIKNKQKNLVFVTGVPGSGKTLAALKVLYDYNRYKYSKDKKPLAAIYLSGNGPLISVLQNILDNEIKELGENGKAYVRSMYSYKREHMNNSKPPLENVVIFDEAQRAWDEKKMGSNYSEADFLLKAGNKIYRTKGSATIICFIGEGQAIHTGEEEEIKLWQRSLNKKGINQWHLYTPPKYEELFNNAETVKVDQRLNLDYSIRSHFIDTNLWIESLLKGDLISAREHLAEMHQKGFILRITRSFTEGKEFIKQKEVGDQGISYGLLISSKVWDKNIRKYINNGRYQGSYMQSEEVGNWFREESKKFQKGASEFACQGLELDYPIVCFGGDYYYDGSQWKIDSQAVKYHGNKYNDFPEIMKNIYRVLLSRARKGMVIYLPKFKQLDNTYDFLVKSGIREIK
ncbi:DNA/RNA helicase domain-containing protein [Natroniella sp. ANB-PHB2]|uniref:DNA/RNA helicase domain-containing protein n=1 Tax=Natroniella sp. ANB-PHB2 TaxID=3384444 RepID=UPI0038D368D9